MAANTTGRRGILAAGAAALAAPVAAGAAFPAGLPAAGPAIPAALAARLARPAISLQDATDAELVRLHAEAQDRYVRHAGLVAAADAADDDGTDPLTEQAWVAYERALIAMADIKAAGPRGMAAKALAGVRHLGDGISAGEAAVLDSLADDARRILGMDAGGMSAGVG